MNENLIFLFTCHLKNISKETKQVFPVTLPRLPVTDDGKLLIKVRKFEKLLSTEKPFQCHTTESNVLKYY